MLPLVLSSILSYVPSTICIYVTFCSHSSVPTDLCKDSALFIIHLYFKDLDIFVVIIVFPLRI